VAFFWLSSSSSSQEYSYDGNLTQGDIDQRVLYGSPNDLSLIEEDKTYMDQIVDPGGYTASTGCLDILQNRTWGGEQGGNCANTGSGKGDTGSGVFTFGYNTTVISQTQSAIAEALKVADIAVVGYRWQWRVKNADVNQYEEQNQTRADTLVVTITVKDKQGNVLDDREWDYSQYIYDWEQKYGMHWYDPFITGDKIDTITLEVEGQDIGGWAGWYGPEFGNAGIYSILVYDPDPCKAIPIVDPTCEGFIGEAPAEDPAIKQLVIIESTGSIPLSEDELTVLEALEEDNKSDMVIPEPPAVVVEVEEKLVVEQEKETVKTVDALSIAQNAEANALADAAATIENTLTSTATSLANDIMQTEQSTQQAQTQSQQSMQQAQQQSQQSSQQSQSQQSSMGMVGLNILSNDGTFNSSNSFTTESQNLDNNQIAIEITVDTFEIAALDNAISDAVTNLMRLQQNIIREQTEESDQEEELNEPVSNDQEDELVAAALAGSDDEDAQAALLGFNPNFRAYQQPQMTDADFYKPKDIYAGQENYDNPNARLFNGASDATHREMVRQQYEEN
jgi:hypothetical protein